MIWLTDVWASGDTQSQHNETDQRTMQTSNGVLASAYSCRAAGAWVRAHRDPGAPSVRDAAARRPRSASCISRWDSPSCRCRKTSATAFRSGRWSTAFRRTRQPITNADGFKLATARFDTALALVTGTDAASIAIHRVNEIAKARAQIDLGNYAAAAALVADVPTNYQYLLTFSLTTTSSELYLLNGNAAVAVRGWRQLRDRQRRSERDQERAAVCVGERSAHSSDGSDEQHRAGRGSTAARRGLVSFCMGRLIRSRCSPASTRG